MEQWVFRNSGNEKPRDVLRSKIKYHFKETFRPHTVSEYAEIFSRGANADNDKTDNGISVCHNKYPWLYVRALAVAFTLFGLITLIYLLTRDSFDYPVLILFGGLMFNIPLLIFYFELYPKRDFSFVTLIFVVLLGGTLSATISGLGYRFIYGDLFGFAGANWLSLIFTGIWEELAKAVPVILAIIILKKRDPLVCFLIGAAVGTGFSIYEDMGYIFNYSASWYSVNLKWAVLCSVGRGLACVCSHAPWTAVIGWAFGKFKRPLMNYRFYAVLVSSMFLHYWADAPFYFSEVIWYRGGVLIWIAEISATLAIMILMIRNSLRGYASGGRQISLSPSSLTGDRKARLSHGANMAGSITLVLLSFMICIFCVISDVYKYYTVYFLSSSDFVSFMQDGLPIEADADREYDPDIPDYSEFIMHDGVKYAVQEVDIGDYTYYYGYVFDEDAATLCGIEVIADGSIYHFVTVTVYGNYTVTCDYTMPKVDLVEKPNPDSGDTDGDELEEEPSDDEETQPEYPTDDEETEIEEPEEIIDVVQFFLVNYSAGYGYYYDFDANCFAVNMYELQNYSAARIAVAVLAGLIAAGGTAVFITLKIKARRYENAG